MKKLNIKRIENAVCEYGFHRGKHCVLLTTCVTEDSPQMSLQQIHKYVDECKPKLILLQGETDNPQDDPCNPQSFTPVNVSISAIHKVSHPHNNDGQLGNKSNGRLGDDQILQGKLPFAQQCDIRRGSDH